METDFWFWFWAISAAVFLVAEIFTAGFFLFPFGVGAAAAAVAAGFDANPFVQWAVFIAVSIPTLLAARAYARNSARGVAPVDPSERLVGKVGLVVRKIEVSGPPGLVRVAGEEWSAQPEKNHDIPEGERVEVVRAGGAYLVVKLHLGGPHPAAAAKE